MTDLQYILYIGLQVIPLFLLGPFLEFSGHVAVISCVVLQVRRLVAELVNLLTTLVHGIHGVPHGTLGVVRFFLGCESLALFLLLLTFLLDNVEFSSFSEQFASLFFDGFLGRSGAIF